MKFKHLLWMAFALLAVASCKYDDDDLWSAVNDHEERISALETWQKQANENIAALQQLVSTMDYITSVTPVTENGEEIGYRIEFKLSEPITIYHGVDAEVSLKQDEDGNWYWTLDGETLTDAEGNPIRANALKPSLELGKDLPEGAVINDEPEGAKPEQGAVYLTIDEGKTWTKVSGPKGDTGATGPAGSTGSQGEQGEAGADNQGIDVTLHEEEGYVTFTLENGTIFNVPLVSEDSSTGFMIYDKDDETTLENNDAIEIEIINPDQYNAEQLYFKYPEGLKKENISGVIAEVIGQTDDNLSNDPDKNFATRANTDDNKKIGVFVETDDQLGYYMYIKHQGMSTGDTYMIRATLIKNDGSTLMTARTVRFMTYMKVGDILYSDGSFSTKRDESKTPIGIIFYLGEDRIGQAEKDALAQKGVTKPRGLAIALKDATIEGNKLWHNNPGSTGDGEYVEAKDRFLWCVGDDVKKDETIPDETGLANCSEGDATTCYKDISGLANCNFIWNGTGYYNDLEKYPAFNAAKQYANAHNDEIDFPATGWFLPSVGQWIEIINGLGIIADYQKITEERLTGVTTIGDSSGSYSLTDLVNKNGDIIGNINNKMQRAKANGSLSKEGTGGIGEYVCHYWTSSESGEDKAFNIQIRSAGTNKFGSLYLSSCDKDFYDTTSANTDHYVRCILAF